MNQKLFSRTAKVEANDNLSQSLDSFINQENEYVITERNENPVELYVKTHEDVDTQSRKMY